MMKKNSVKVFEICGQETISVCGVGDYLCLSGGYTSFDQGCTPWGSNRYFDSNFIGDRIGEIVLRYSDKSESSVPLIFGYTLWFYEFWHTDMEPFKSDKVLSDALESALFLKGARQKSPSCFLNIRLAKKPLETVYIKHDPEKFAEPLFYSLSLYSGQPEVIDLTARDGEPVQFVPSDPFYAEHTVTCFDNIPESVSGSIEKINRATLTYFSDLDMNFKSEKKPQFRFTGDAYAELATEILFENELQLVGKVDENGLFHASNENAYLWYYHGFGPYHKKSAFYGKLYSRDAGRSIMTLLLMDKTEKASAATDCLHRWLMYYPEKYPELTFNGSKIPGHWSVMPNFPLIYSKELVPNADWPTQFTREKFGDEYQNLGNLETDGHGLTMMAVYCLWVCLGRSKEWLEKNFGYIREAAEFLVWQTDNPEMTFTKDDLLYGETEGAMNDYTLYANIPCMLGLRVYDEMAAAYGDTETQARWKQYSDRLSAAIERNLLKNGEWQKYGFFHDPVLTMFFDITGCNIKELLPEHWLKASENTYETDAGQYAKDSYFAPRGLGYDQNMITQNSLILDNRSDAEKFIQNLIRLCYAPRLPEPFIVPEGATVDTEKGRIRRQGDLGNLIQQSETIKTFFMIAGISMNTGNAALIAPKLPDGWIVTYNKVRLPGLFGDDNGETYIDGKYESTEKHCRLTAEIINVSRESEISFRFGPFPIKQKSAAVMIGDSAGKVCLYRSGESNWCNIALPKTGNINITVHKDPG